MQLEQQAIQSLTQQIVEAVHPLRMVLFGSAAHGKAEPGSDIDLLIECRRAPIAAARHSSSTAPSTASVAL